MSDVRNYFRKKQKKEQFREDYREKIRRHRLEYTYRTMLIGVVVLIIVVLCIVIYNSHVYTGYETVSTVSIENAEGAENKRLGECVLTYSKDGAHCTNPKGVVAWNQTYEVQDMQMDINRDVVAIANYDGREIFIQNSEKQLGTVTTTMPIKDIAVAANGNVTAVLSDTDVTWVNTYSPDGKLMFTGPTHMDQAGYPVAVSLSPNGMLLAVSFTYIDAGSMKSNVVFYNFGPVGENMNDHIVSAYTYTDMLIPEIRFIDDETAFAVGDGRVMVFKGGQIPTDSFGYVYSKQIQSVYYSDKYVGIVLGADDAEHTYMMDVYGRDGKKVRTIYFDLEYTDIFFEDSDMVIYNETECLIVTYGGTVKFDGFFEENTELLIPMKGAYRYMLVTGDNMEVIQLK